MLQRIRYAVEHEAFKIPLRGIVEVDETCHGGKRTGKRGRDAAGKTPIVGMMEREGEIRCKAVTHVKSRTVCPLVRENVSFDSTLMTDEFTIYPGIADGWYRHEVVNHGAKKYVRGDIHTNNLECFLEPF